MAKEQFGNPRGSKGYGQNIVPSGGAAAGAQSAKEPVSAIAAANSEVNKFDEGGSANLHNKSYDGNTKQMERLLDKLADIDLPTNDQYGDTPLHKAVSGGHLEAVRLLIRSGAEVNKKNKTDQTPGHYAAFYCNPPIIQELLTAKADPMAREDEFGDDWLHKVADSKCANNATKKEIFNLLKEAGATMVQNDDHKTAIDYAHGNPELIGMLHEVYGDSQE